MSNSNLFQALGGGASAQVPQQAAPSPAPSGAPGGGSIFQALAQSPMNQAGPMPAQLGPQVADNTGLMQGNPFYKGASAPQEHAPAQPAVYHPQSQAPEKQPTPGLAQEATNFFNRMRK